MGRNMTIKRLGISPEDNAFAKANWRRLERALKAVDDRLEKNQWLAGSEFTAADVMTVFSLTTMRVFMSVDIGVYKNILGYLQRVGARGAYWRAMGKGGPRISADAVMNQR